MHTKIVALMIEHYDFLFECFWCPKLIEHALPLSIQCLCQVGEGDQSLVWAGGSNGIIGIFDIKVGKLFCVGGALV